MTLLHKDVRFEIKATDDEGVVEGYASVFGGAPDSYGDVIAPGAFAESLTAHRRSGTAPLMLWGHNSSEPPIGNWSELAEDGKGLWVKGTIDLEDALGLRVHRALKRKAMKGLSIGYETKSSEDDPKRPGIRLLTGIDLWEISPVNFPAQPRAAIDTVKSYIAAGALPSQKEFEALLREAGISNSRSRFIVNHGFAALLLREAGKGNSTQTAVDFLTALRG